MRTELITVRTGSTAAVHDLTADCERFVGDVADSADPRGHATSSGLADGLLNVFVPHATAGLAILETGAGSDSDLLAALDEILSRDRRWRHQHGSAGHGRDHVLPALLSPSTTVPVIAGRLALGAWQSICLVDTNIDNAEREVRLSFVKG
jgi:secondary thiamine-phosphate synthase enzyme